ncbi:hypothetical protein K7V51_002996 [Escherichia coli]|nr:hypothetical protein [Escherichia coli]
MRDDRFNSLKREFDGAPEDAAGALLSVADMMKAAYFLINMARRRKRRRRHRSRIKPRRRIK